MSSNAKKREGAAGARVIGAGLAAALRALSFPFGNEMGSRIAGHAAFLVAPIVQVRTSRGTMRFWCPSSTSAKYAVNFMRYEPDTRAWIESRVKAGDHMWDVGANIGAYTLYASLLAGVTVTAFEPVANTYAALVKNVSLNPFAKETVALPIALSNANTLAPYYLRNTEVGGAMHALGAPETFDGPFEAVGVQNVVSLRGDDLVKNFGAHPPDHVKLDVDGHELFVLMGMTGILPDIRTLWIEMEDGADASGENARIEAFLLGKGFTIMQTGRNCLFVNGRLAPRG
jgi:FkbM family methyltransferase